MTEVYDHTSVPWRWVILDKSRGTKTKAVSEEKCFPPQDESESGDVKMADLFRMISEGIEKQNKKSNQ